MKPVIRLLYGLLSLRSASDKKLSLAVLRITGSRPKNLGLYKLALRHSSAAGNENAAGRSHNERLEFLGDAILGAVVADFLFRKFPYKAEGFLTEIRSRLVNREAMAQLAMKIGLGKLIEYNHRNKGPHANRSMHGDAMEAFIGAVYLDKGFDFSKKFILNQLIANHFDLDELVESDNNHKSRLIEWAQRRNKNLRFDTIESGGADHAREFTATVVIEGELTFSGKGMSKKKAEQAAAGIALEGLRAGGEA
ncbi:MAG: ribonuclease III [Bacteroidota bacterium]